MINSTETFYPHTWLFYRVHLMPLSPIFLSYSRAVLFSLLSFHLASLCRLLFRRHFPNAFFFRPHSPSISFHFTSLGVTMSLISYHSFRRQSARANCITSRAPDTYNLAHVGFPIPILFFVSDLIHAECTFVRRLFQFLFFVQLTDQSIAQD